MNLQARWYRDTLPLAGARVVDVGANVGALSAFFFDAVGPTGSVLSVEPLAPNLDALRARIAAAGDPTRWTVAPCAASDHDGEVSLRLGGDEETAHNSVVVPDGAAAAGRVRVPCRRLSSLAADATVVKLDIEGHEYAVLDEALAALPGVRAWAIEYHLQPGRSLRQSLDALRACGFALYGAGRRRSDPNGPWVTAEIPAALDWDNLPVASRRADGTVFKMLHVVARR
jgi:FkbM family methyltransferase